MQTHGKPASRFEDLDRKLKCLEGFWPLLGRAWARKGRAIQTG